MILINILLLLLISNVIIGDDRLIEIAQSPDYQWNGVALTKTNRIFGSFPRSYQDVILSVAEILSNKSLMLIHGGD